MTIDDRSGGGWRRVRSTVAAVVVVLFEIGDEATPRNPVVQTVLDYLPLAQDMLMPVPDRRDLSQLLPADPGYYNFVGALSSPPCTEGVLWLVLQQPVQMPLPAPAQLPALPQRRDDVPDKDDEADEVGAPDIGAVSVHGKPVSHDDLHA